MKLEVTETNTNLLDNSSSEIKNVFNFTDKQTSGKLNFGTVFQAEIQKDDRSVEVSLIRQVDKDNFEVYSKKTIYASHSASFEDYTTTNNLKMTFKLIK